MRLSALLAPARAGAFAVGAALLALVTVTLQGCDNPACVFGGDCSGSAAGGALGGLAALPPEDGQIVRAAAPTIVRFAPNGANADPNTPIVVVFSEAMSPATLGSVFQLEQVGFGTLPLSATALIGDGRVLVLFPIQELTASAEYRLKFRENGTLGDRTGQAVVRPDDDVVGSFTVAAEPPEGPSVLLTYPENAEAGLPATTEIDVVFTRAIDASTVDDLTFLVEVDGAPPPFDGDAVPVQVGGVQSDTRAFRWRSRDDAGLPASLGTDLDVTVDLAEIADEDGNLLSPTGFTFRTLPFSAPLAARITSFPEDAIGIQNVSGASDLAVEVEFEDAQVGDDVGVFVFGVQPEDVEAPKVIALFRNATITDPPQTFTFTAAELDLVLPISTLSGRVRDGTIAMAFRVRRGNLESPVRLLDVDPVASGAQGPVLDLTAPTLTGIGVSGTSTSFASDARDVVLVGRASEELRAAYVETALGNNEIRPGTPPPVVGSDPASFAFIAAPVRVGILLDTDQPLTYSLTIYDRALNAGGTATGEYRQRGAAASGIPGPLFSSILVEVFDAATLLPIAGADVYSHERDPSDGAIFLADQDVTDADGRVVVDPALIGDTVITVRRNGYDLFTFDGVPTDALSIPLTPSAQFGATIRGEVASTDPSISALTRTMSDSRFPRPGETLASVSSCTLNTMEQRFECGFGPAPIKARELGGASAMAVLPQTNPFLWNAQAFLHDFGVRIPLADQAPNAVQTTTIVMDQLTTIGIDPELLALDAPAHALTTAAWPMLNGDPRVRVEGLVPGLRGPLTVGQGLAFDDGLPPSTFAVRAAYPGVADPFVDGADDQLGELVANGVLEPDLFLRAEVVDPDGARGIDRPRLSTTDMALDPPPAPTFGPTPVTLNSTGLAYDVAFADVLSDAAGQGGLHRAVLTDLGGRRWVVWRIDEPDAAGPDAVLHLPLATVGEPFPLGGALSLVASSWSWTAFDPASFLWTDVDREFERAAHSAGEPVSIP